MLPVKEVKELYKRYGFKEGRFSNQYGIFVLERGYFQNAEIVVLDESTDKETLNRVKEEYEGVGYSARISPLSDISSLHDALFKGFFRLGVANDRLKIAYDTFCAQQKKKILNNEYEYINGAFIENGLVYETNIIERIFDIFSSPECQLVILEASAGYGKTCTSFEVMRWFAEQMDSKVTLMAELSKNRSASVFRYVLLSEINEKFSDLGYELVTAEIKNGRVLLIIDGFDELLSKTVQKVDASSEKDTLTMLETIAQLFPENAKTKVLLTSRKSSIFSGQDWEDWFNRNPNIRNVTRLQLSTPSLKDWIGSEKLESLKENGINVNHILNPVLLSLLRNRPVEDFKQKYTDNESIIREYLSLLLNREKERQDIPLELDEQLSIMSGLAAFMVQLDISSAQADDIKELLREVLGKNLQGYIERYRYRSDSESKPSEDEFLTKLSQHALLDRVASQSNHLIGFINDFIFGLMIGNALLKRQLPAKELSGKYLDIAVTAYSSRDDAKKKEFFKAISPALRTESAQKKVDVSIHLINEIKESFQDEQFSGLSFENIAFSSPEQFCGCTFTECIFRECSVDVSSFKGCYFYDCKFYSITVTGNTVETRGLLFLSCTGQEDFKRVAAGTTSVGLNPASDVTDYERTVLEQYWKPGYDKAAPRRAYQTLLKGLPTNEQPTVAEAIASLEKKGILTRRLRSYDLNFSKMKDIRTILGR